MARAQAPIETRRLLERVERGDREAAYDLARLLRPDDLADLIGYVCPDAPPRPDLFGVLVDAYRDYLDTTDR